MIIRKRAFYIITFILCVLLVSAACGDMSQFEEFTDSDGDGWSDAQEKLAGTDPQKLDTDNDGYWDPHDANPLDADIPVVGGAAKQSEAAEQPAPPEEEIVEPEQEKEQEEQATLPEAPPETDSSLAAKEMRMVQKAVKEMMRNNALTEIENPVALPTSDMHRFPDATTEHGDAGTGYVLFLYDFNGDGHPDTNYYPKRYTDGTYTCDRFGNVTQLTTGQE
jgi:hypothetical protein